MPPAALRLLVRTFPTAFLTGSDIDTGATRPAKRGLHSRSNFEKTARAYAAARLDHLFSATPDRAEYLAIVTDPSASADEESAELVAAAKVFASSD